MIKQDFFNTSQQNEKKIALLIDPDKTFGNKLTQLVLEASECGVDYFFYGGSLINKSHFENEIFRIKEFSKIPVVLFPGHNIQVSAHADAILFLSLLSGRNPEFLIGQQMVAAPFVKSSGIESIATAYLLIDGGRITTAHYMSNSLPIPNDKNEIAVNTAVAAELLGFNCIYLDAGSGALQSVPDEMISAVKYAVNIPLIVGGGIKSAERLKLAFDAGADIAVIGTAIENSPGLLKEFVNTKRNYAKV